MNTQRLVQAMGLLHPVRAEQEVLYQNDGYTFRILREGTTIFLDFTVWEEKQGISDFSFVHAEIAKPEELLMALRNAIVSPFSHHFSSDQGPLHLTCYLENTFFIQMVYQTKRPDRMVSLKVAVGIFIGWQIITALEEQLNEWEKARRANS